MNGEKTPLRNEPRFRLAFLKPAYWRIWLGLLLLFFLCALPRAWRDSIAAAGGKIHYRLNHKRRRYADINLRLCFPTLQDSERQALICQHFQAAAQMLIDWPVMLFIRPKRLRRLVKIEAPANLEALILEHQIIFLTCHSCALETGAFRLSLDYPMVSIYNDFKNPLVDWLAFRIRGRYPIALARRNSGLRGIVKTTREGRLFYYIPDEDLGAKNSTWAAFFGQPKTTLMTLGRLARLCDAKVLPCYTWYDRKTRQYCVRIMPALENFPSADEQLDARNMNAAIEALINLQPAAYMWTLRLFKTRPNGERSPYKQRQNAIKN